MLIKVSSAANSGLETIGIDVEVNLANRGLPAFEIVGLPSKAVDESRERVKTAIVNSNIEFPTKRITVNLAPADVPKEGSFYDLPIATGVLASIMNCELPRKSLFFGELSLDGTLRHTKGALLLSLFAKERGIKSIFVPKASANEAAIIKGVRVYPVESINQLLAYLLGQIPLEPAKYREVKSEAVQAEFDMAEILGQEQAKRAMEISAAGGAPWSDLVLQTNNTDRVSIKAGSGNVGIGTTSPNGEIELAAEGNVNTLIYVSTYADAATKNSELILRTADNTMASPQPIDSGDQLGLIVFQGWDNDGWDSGAYIEAKADANWGASERGTDLSFYTRDGSGAITEQMLIDAAGNVGIGATSPGAQLHVGNNSAAPGNANGAEDVFIESDLEVDATAYLDGPVVMGGAMSVVSAITQTDASGENAIGGNLTPTTNNAYSLGTSGNKWSDIWVVTSNVGDIAFANDFRATEIVTDEGNDALAFVNDKGVQIMVVDSDGNLFVKGEVRTLEQ